MKLAAFLAALDLYTGRIPLGELVRRLRELDLGLDEVAPFMRFAEGTYRRNLMHEGPAYQALVICWRNGQRSPIHDHRGSSCAVRVLKGEAVETLFSHTRSGIFPSRSRRCSAGDVLASQDAEIHQVSNLAEDGGDLVSLHVYSPPLLAMGVYSLFHPLVAEFQEELLIDGGGI